MKKISAIITALVTGAALTGCTFGASIDTLMAPPKLGAEQEDIYNALTKAEGTSISLKYPKSGKYLSAFIIEDIDGDGGDEALVFYERNNHAADENPLRMNILDKKDGKWCSVRDKATAGSEIEEVIISRLGSNKRINLIVGTSILNRSEGRRRFTVFCIMVSPSLVRERNCFGLSFLLFGQKRSPLPPAMITAVIFIWYFPFF